MTVPDGIAEILDALDESRSGIRSMAHYRNIP